MSGGGGGAFGFMNRFQVVRSVWHLDVMSTYIMDNAMVGSSFTRGFTIVMCHCSTDVKVVSRVHFDLTNNKFDLNVQDTSDNPTAYTIQNGRFQSRFYIRQPKASHVAQLRLSRYFTCTDFPRPWSSRQSQVKSIN
jgi:hypothetical protein